MHNLDMTNGRANIAFIGSRNNVWHRMGQEMLPGMSIPEWAKAAGLEWSAIKVPAIALLGGAEFGRIPTADRLRKVEGRNFIVRSDNGQPLGYCSDRYQIVQPAEVLAWFERYIGVDDRFQLDVAGSLGQGETIWATATFRDKLEVAGEAHQARVLMTTTFDGSGATINQGTMTRTVCQNTLKASLSDRRAAIRTTHTAKFDAAKVGEELAAIAQGFKIYKAMGDALAQNEMAAAEVSNFFKAILDIPFEVPMAEVSTRKLNQFDALKAAYSTSVAEGAANGSAWAALNAITRYVDHERSARGDNVDGSRFNSANFGSGASLKAKAVELLLPRVADKLALAA